MVFVFCVYHTTDTQTNSNHITKRESDREIERERERERERVERECVCAIVLSRYYRFFDFGQKTEIGHGPNFE